MIINEINSNLLDNAIKLISITIMYSDRVNKFSFLTVSPIVWVFRDWEESL